MSHSIKNSQQGAIIIWGLFTLGLFSLFLFLLLGHFQSLITTKQLRNTCRSELMYLQDEAAQYIDKVLKFNKPIRMLKMIREGSSVAIFIPGLNIYATVTKQTAEIALNTLVTTRQGIILAGDIKMRARLIKASTKISELAHNLASPIYKIETTSPLPAFRPVGLAVRKVNPKSRHSEMELSPDFEKIQSVQLTWTQTTQLKKDSPVWTLIKSPKTQYLMPPQVYGCQVTLQKNKEGGLVPTLTAETSWLKPRYFF